MAFGNLVEKEDVVNSITTKDHGIFLLQLPSLVPSKLVRFCHLVFWI